MSIVIPETSKRPGQLSGGDIILRHPDRDEPGQFTVTDIDHLGFGPGVQRVAVDYVMPESGGQVSEGRFVVDHDVDLTVLDRAGLERRRWQHNAARVLRHLTDPDVTAHLPAVATWSVYDLALSGRRISGQLFSHPDDPSSTLPEVRAWAAHLATAVTFGKPYESTPEKTPVWAETVLDGITVRVWNAIPTATTGSEHAR